MIFREGTNRCTVEYDYFKMCAVFGGGIRSVPSRQYGVSPGCMTASDVTMNLYIGMMKRKQQ